MFPRSTPKTLEEALVRIAELERLVEELLRKNAELVERLEKNSRNSSKPPSTDSPRDKERNKPRKRSER